MQQPQHALASTPQPQQHPLQGATPTERNHHKEQVIAWLRDTFYVGESGSIAKGSVYKEYQQLCERHRWTALSSPALGKIVHKAFPDLKGVRKGVRGKAVYHYKNLNYLHSQSQREHQPPPLPHSHAPAHYSQQQGILHTHQIQPLPPYPQQPQQPQMHLKPQPQSPPHRLLPVHSPQKQRLPSERSEPEDFSQGRHGPVKSFIGERRQAAHSALWDTDEMKQITQNYYLRNSNENNHKTKTNDDAPDPYDQFANDSGLFNINDGGQMLQSLLNALDIRIRKSFSSSSSSFSDFTSALSDPTLNLTFSVPTPPLTTTTTTTSTTTTATTVLPQTTSKTFQMQLEEEQLKNLIMGLFSRILLALIRSFQAPDWRTGQANREADLRKIVREFWVNEELREFMPDQADMILFFLNCGTLFLLDEITNETEIMPPEIRPAFLKCVALDLPCWANAEVSSRPEISKMGNFKEHHHRIWINFSKELEKRYGVSTDDGQGFESL